MAKEWYSLKDKISRVRTWTGLYRLLKKACYKSNVYVIEDKKDIAGFAMPVAFNNFNGLIYLKPMRTIQYRCIILLHEIGHLYSEFDDLCHCQFTGIIPKMKSERDANRFMRDSLASTKIKFSHGDKSLIGYFAKC